MEILSENSKFFFFLFHRSFCKYVSPGILAEGGILVALRVGTPYSILKEKRPKNKRLTNITTIFLPALPAINSFNNVITPK